jgi:hypothetical protein
MAVLYQKREIALLMLSFPNAKHWGVTHALSRDEQLEIVTSALGTEAPTFPRRVLQQQPAALRPEEVVNLQETGGF